MDSKEPAEKDGKPTLAELEQDKLHQNSQQPVPSPELAAATEQVDTVQKAAWISATGLSQADIEQGILEPPSQELKHPSNLNKKESRTEKTTDATIKMDIAQTEEKMGGFSRTSQSSDVCIADDRIEKATDAMIKMDIARSEAKMGRSRNLFIYTTDDPAASFPCSRGQVGDASTATQSVSNVSSLGPDSVHPCDLLAGIQEMPSAAPSVVGAVAVGGLNDFNTYSERQMREGAWDRNSSEPHPFDDGVAASDIDNGLIEAHPVASRHLDLGVAMPMAPKEGAVSDNGVGTVGDKKKRHHLLGALIILGAIILVAGLAVGLSSRSDSKDNGGTDSVSSTTTLPPTYSVETTAYGLDLALPLFLPNATLEIIKQDINGSTPQCQAYQWLQEDPYLETYSENTERLLQRFAMVAFFHATGGNITWDFIGGGTRVVYTGLPPTPPASPALVTEDSPDKGDNGTRRLQGTGEAQGRAFNITSEPWLSYEHNECLWFNKAEMKGVSPCDDQGHLISLVLRDGTLGGSLPAELGLLTNLKVLDLLRNNIEGTIPKQLASLTSLVEFNLISNKLRGSIPSQLGKLTTLEEFDVLNNRLTSSLPTELFQLSLLRRLLFARNDMTGSLPEDIGIIWPDMEIIRAGSNQLTGSIPSSIGLCQELLILDFKNQLHTGTLPTELGLLSKLNALVFPTNRNLLGPLPSELGLLNTTLTDLTFRDSSITGTIPENLCALEVLLFDCSPTLCGCDCPCAEANSTFTSNTTLV